jgi:hypothetical protein
LKDHVVAKDGRECQFSGLECSKDRCQP